MGRRLFWTALRDGCVQFPLQPPSQKSGLASSSFHSLPGTSPITWCIVFLPDCTQDSRVPDACPWWSTILRSGRIGEETELIDWEFVDGCGCRTPRGQDRGISLLMTSPSIRRTRRNAYHTVFVQRSLPKRTPIAAHSMIGKSTSLSSTLARRRDQPT
ncbi:hypothetical protein VTI74DRAFT_2138 [Chaetomium olivicolor]